MSLDPITRNEIYLNSIAENSGTNLEPVTRKEMFLAKIAGQDIDTPNPITREEIYLNAISEGGGGGGGNTTKYTVQDVNVTSDMPKCTRDFENFVFVARMNEDEVPTTLANNTVYFMMFVYYGGFIINEKAYVVRGTSKGDKAYAAAPSKLSVSASTITFSAYADSFMAQGNWKVCQFEIPSDFNLYSFI